VIEKDKQGEVCMVLKAAERFYLTLEVDMDSMTVILIKDGEEGRTYDASQYFQYFVEYGVRKTDVVQLQEHFSIDYFQNMLVTGKHSETFEFCVQFAGQDYKILKCKMKLLESQNSNIIKILLEDISHKRVQQLIYIKDHFQQHQHKSYAKPFDIKFEEQKNNSAQALSRYRYAIIITCILCIFMSVAFFQNIYSKNLEKATGETLNNCRNTNQYMTMQLKSISRNLLSFKDLISGVETKITKKQLIDYVEKQKKQYGVETIFFVDEKGNLLLTEDTEESANFPYMNYSYDYNKTNEFFLTGDYINGNAVINYIVPIEGMKIGRTTYKNMVTIFDLNKICTPTLLSANSNSQDIVIINKDGDILWSGSAELSTFINQKNVFDYFNNSSVGINPADRVDQLSKQLEQGKSGTFNFMINGQRKFVAYTPLEIENLYLVSVSKNGEMTKDTIKLIALSILAWGMVLLLPIMILFYQIRRMKGEKAYLEKLVYSDNVTGAMNKKYFDKKAKSIISEMECTYALVATNLRNFSLYNSKHGHARGNELIRRVFLGITKYIDSDELVCRDYAEHMMILMKCEGEKQLEERLMRIGKCIIDTNFKMEFGICIIRDLTMDLKVAKERARMALRNECNSPRDNIIIAYYDVNLLEKALFEKKLENTMYRAFRNGEFKIFVEPRYNLKTRALCNGDAYAVWEHPEKGTLMPEQYVGIFERRGLIMCLDSFIFEEICKKIKEHLDKGRACMSISIKLHRNHFNATDFINKFKRIKERYGIPGECIAFRISEGILYERIYQIDKIISSIHEMGAVCIIDEYRGRYLPLEVLCRIHIDSIKFSPDFLKGNLPNDMIEALIKIAKGAKAKAIMPGVSSQSQIAYLNQIACDEAKGDAFAKNISLDEYINIF